MISPYLQTGFFYHESDENYALVFRVVRVVRVFRG